MGRRSRLFLSIVDMGGSEPQFCLVLEGFAHYLRISIVRLPSLGALSRENTGLLVCLVS